MIKFWKHAIFRMIERNISELEVNEVFENPHIRLKSYRKRTLLLGQTNAERYLFIALEKEEVVTVRVMSKKEIRYFETRRL